MASHPGHFCLRVPTAFTTRRRRPSQAGETPLWFSAPPSRRQCRCVTVGAHIRHVIFLMITIMTPATATVCQLRHFSFQFRVREFFLGCNSPLIRRWSRPCRSSYLYPPVAARKESHRDKEAQCSRAIL